MKRNRVPTTVRLRMRIERLLMRLEDAHEPPRGSNPYGRCRFCGIRDPQISINNGRHFSRCPMQGVDKQIEHYRQLLAAEENRSTP